MTWIVWMLWSVHTIFLWVKVNFFIFTVECAQQDAAVCRCSGSVTELREQLLPPKSLEKPKKSDTEQARVQNWTIKQGSVNAPCVRPAGGGWRKRWWPEDIGPAASRCCSRTAPSWWHRGGAGWSPTGSPPTEAPSEAGWFPQRGTDRTAATADTHTQVGSKIIQNVTF